LVKDLEPEKQLPVNVLATCKNAIFLFFPRTNEDLYVEQTSCTRRIVNITLQALPFAAIPIAVSLLLAANHLAIFDWSLPMRIGKTITILD